MKEQEVIFRIKDELERTLGNIPFIEIVKSRLGTPLSGAQIDLMIDLKIRDRFQRLLVESKSLGEPRLVRSAIQQLQEYLSRINDAYAIVGAPYISNDTANICKQNQVGYIDLAGNCFVNFDQVYIERKNYPNPVTEKRQARSIFSPKSSRILRVMLSNPKRRPWKVQDLAREANVSLGLASKVKERLLDLEYAIGDNKSVMLTRPLELLERWANSYSFRKNKIYDYFSFDDPKEIERKLSQYCEQRQIPYALTLFSGAALVAPFTRYTRGFAYVGKNMESVANELGLKEVSSGPNFSILEPYDEGIFYGSEKIENMRVVSTVQLYLDLVSFKGRGEESAKYLFEQRIKSEW